MYLSKCQKERKKKILELAFPPTIPFIEAPLKKKKKKGPSTDCVAAFPIVSSSMFITSYPRYKKKFHFHYFIDRVTKGCELFFSSTGRLLGSFWVAWTGVRRKDQSFVRTQGEEEKYDLLEKQNVGLGRVNLVVLPAQTLRDSQTPPLFLVENLECSSLDIEVILGDGLQHLLREHHVPDFLVSPSLLLRRRRSRVVELLAHGGEGGEGGSMKRGGGERCTCTRRPCRSNCPNVSEFSWAHKGTAMGRLTDQSSGSNR